jgi:glycosyltransferase involved in cell wall biosynthesis
MSEWSEAAAAPGLSRPADEVGVSGRRGKASPEAAERSEREVMVILPNDIDDPATPSGGNAYDRQVCRGLTESGWTVHEYPVYGAWPEPSDAERAGLARVLADLPDHALVLVDGLIASAVPDVLVPVADRLRLVALVHMPRNDDAERQVLAAVRAIVTTSSWTRDRLLDRYALPADRVHVATPGAVRAPLAPWSDDGSRLLCVAAVTPQKGYDLLADALAKVADLPWSCVCVGSLSRDPEFVDRFRRQIQAYGLAGRMRLVGPLTGAELDTTYASSDLLVLASRGETYGMVVTEAVARGIPVLATAVGGLPEALGRAPDGSLPGVLVPPDDPGTFAGALRRWLTEPDLRRRLRQAARDRRATLTGWAVTAGRVSDTLRGVPA